MADVRPLHGIRYSSETVSDLAQVVTPPFDIISPEAQARYYARHPYNIIRLELTRDEAGDSTLNNRYTRAARTLAEWRLQHVLRQDALPPYYLYQQKFTHGGQTYTRTSLIARVRLEPWSARVILPHEHTMSKPKDDRLKLLRACAANFSPLMSMYEDPQGRMRRLLSTYAAQAEIYFTDEVNEEHLLHPITDAQQLAHIHDFFAERQLYVADGHHRYETALNYREEVREQRKVIAPDDAVNFVLMALIDVDDPGLLVLPTHRLLLGLSAERLEALSQQNLARYFTVRELAADEAGETLLQQLARADEEAPSFIINTTGQNLLLSLNEHGRARMSQTGHSEAWNELDVSVAHTLVLEELMELSAADATAGTYLRYTPDARQALRAVQAGEAQAALLLNATKVRQICAVSQAQETMPQKSTYFYPKLITGLVLNPLW